VEGPADVMEAWEFAVWDKAWRSQMLARIRLMPCHASTSLPVTALQMPCTQIASLHDRVGLNLAHGHASEPMFEPRMGKVNGATPWPHPSANVTGEVGRWRCNLGANGTLH
jgi:hypothetical protein